MQSARADFVRVLGKEPVEALAKAGDEVETRVQRPQRARSSLLCHFQHVRRRQTCAKKKQNQHSFIRCSFQYCTEKVSPVPGRKFCLGNTGQTVFRAELSKMKKAEVSTQARCAAKIQSTSSDRFSAPPPKHTHHHGGNITAGKILAGITPEGESNHQ